MPSIPDLPSELMVQIMCQCSDIKTILWLAATCRNAHQAWRDNAAYVVSAVLSFTTENLDDALDFARFEASTSEMPCLTTIDGSDRDSAVRRYLPSIERTGYSASAIRTEYFSEMAKLLKRHPHPTHRSLNFMFEIFPDFCKSFLVIRRLATGYDHLETLAAAYTKLHDSSSKELDCIYIVGEILQLHCQPYGHRMGIGWHDGEERYWSVDPEDYYYMPLSWEFAIETINIETDWRFNCPSDNTHQQYFDEHHLYFDPDKVALMYGANKTPWTKKWARAAENIRAPRSAQFDDIIQIWK